MKMRHGCTGASSLDRARWTAASYLSIRECRLERKVELQWGDDLALLPRDEPRPVELAEQRTTARLMATESASHARVMGGTCITQASTPTGMLAVVADQKVS